MEEHGSVTRWLQLWQEGDEQAANELWQRYTKDLISLARGRLSSSSNSIRDEEDATLEAFDAVLRAVKQGRYSSADKCLHRDEFWKILVVSVCRKTTDYWRASERERNAVERLEIVPEGLSALTPEQIAGNRELFINFVSELEEYDQDHPANRIKLFPIFMLRLQKYSNSEIAADQGIGKSSVELAMRKIREMWSKHWKF